MDKQFKLLFFCNTASKCSMPYLIMGMGKDKVESEIQIPKDWGVGEGARWGSFIKMQWFGGKTKLSGLNL